MDTGWVYPTVGENWDHDANGGAVWTNPNYACADDSNRAVSRDYDALIPGTPQLLVVRGFDFSSIPPEASLVGIEAKQKIRRHVGSSQFTDDLIRLYLGGMIGNDKGIQSNILNSDSDVEYSWGSSNDLWGTSLTVADVQSSSFGWVADWVYASGLSFESRVAVNAMPLKIHYKLPGEGPRKHFQGFFG